MIWNHISKCFLAGLVAILPIGALVLIFYLLDQKLDPLIKQVPYDFTGRGILAGVIAIYILGLTVSTVVGKWLWSHMDRLLSRLPGLAVLYATLKQILGYGSGKDAMFRSVVLVKGVNPESFELGLVTEEVRLEGQPLRLVIFVPGSPNPTVGRMVMADPDSCVVTKIPVDVAMKALLSTGKTGLTG